MSESANRRRDIAMTKRLWLATFLILALALPAAGQDRKKPAPYPMEGGGSGGAVFCGWATLVLVQAVTEYCGWARQPVDDAIDEAIAPIEDFIVANYPSHPTHSMLEDTKRQITAMFRGNSASPQACEIAARTFPAGMRSRASPSQVRLWTQEILSTPREQLSGACY